MQSNPYRTALLWLGGGGILLAIILAALANAQLGDVLGDAALARALGAWADISGVVGVTALVGALVVSALLWKPSDTPEPPPMSLDRAWETDHGDRDGA